MNVARGDEPIAQQVVVGGVRLVVEIDLASLLDLLVGCDQHGVLLWVDGVGEFVGPVDIIVRL